jgi:hypothetical protein
MCYVPAKQTTKVCILIVMFYAAQIPSVRKVHDAPWAKPKGGFAQGAISIYHSHTDSF